MFQFFLRTKDGGPGHADQGEDPLLRPREVLPVHADRGGRRNEKI